MTVRFIEQETKSESVQLNTLKQGDAFFTGGTYFIVSDEGGDDDAENLRRCMDVSDNIGRISHFYNDIKVVPTTLIISKEE
jgi:hypothetical protein